MEKYQKDNRGVVLIIALMILSAIMFSALVLSKVLVGEVKMSLNVANVAVAFHTAESGIEKALYYVKYSREYSDNTLFTDLQNQTGKDNLYYIDDDFSMGYDIAESTIDAQDFIAYNVSTSSPVHVDIVDPSGNIDPISIAWASGAVSYNVDWEISNCFPDHATDKLEVTINSFDANFANPEIEKRISICDCDYQSEQCKINLTDYSIANNKFYRFSFRPLDSEIKQLQFNLYEDSSPIGILSETNIKVSGRFHTSEYSIQARIPSMAPLSDAFNYVIFTEESLVKDL